MFKKTLISSVAACALMISANAFAQDNDWQSIPDNTAMLDRGMCSQGARIAAEVGGALVGAGMTLSAGFIVSYIADHKQYVKNGGTDGKKEIMNTAFIVSAVITPFAEAGFIHWVGDEMGSWGKGWTPYAGGVVGGALGAGLGAIGFIDDDDMGCMTTWIGAAAGAIIGAITWYEISHNQEISKSTISNLHPVLEVTDRYTSLGFGFDF